MRNHSKSTRQAFKAEQARKEAYWMEQIQASFAHPFSWAVNIKNSKYRRTPKPIKSL